MVVSKYPRIHHLARAVAAPLSLLFIWDVVVTVVYLKVPHSFRTLELPLSLFGTVIALFIGFMVNAAYARWWEARVLCGAMANASRSLARQALTFCDETDRGPPDIARDIVRSQIGYVQLLKSTLRGEPVGPEVATYLGASDRGRDGGPPNAAAILMHIARLAGKAVKDGVIDPFARVRIESTLVEITNASGGMDRIKNTPLPSQYRFFPYLFARLFCVLLPFAVVDDLGMFTPIGSTLISLMFLMAVQIGHDLMNPFANGIHDVPLTSICRTIEIDLLTMMDEAGPERIVPRDGVLW